jgi:hypothetical protein
MNQRYNQLRTPQQQQPRPVGTNRQLFQDAPWTQQQADYYWNVYGPAGPPPPMGYPQDYQQGTPPQYSPGAGMDATPSPNRSNDSTFQRGLDLKHVPAFDGTNWKTFQRRVGLFNMIDSGTPESK